MFSGGGSLTNTKLLLLKIKSSGLKIGFIADKMGLSRATLSYKINNHSDFKAGEIAMLRNILRLSQDEQEAIFFGDVLTKK